MKAIILTTFFLGSIATFSFMDKNSDSRNGKGNHAKFIEVTVQNHLVSHGFDEDNKEIIEEVIVDEPNQKLIAVDRIQSITEKYILTTYGYGRLVYWEYEGSYEEIKEKLFGLE